MCEYFACNYVCVCTIWAHHAHGGQERALDRTELELRMVVSCHAGAESQSQTVCKSPVSTVEPPLQPRRAALQWSEKDTFHILEKWLYSQCPFHHFCVLKEVTEAVPSHLTFCLFLAWNCSVLFFTDLISMDKAGSRRCCCCCCCFCAGFPVSGCALSTA